MTDFEKLLYMQLYAGIVAMTNHPRNEHPKTPSECVDLANEYYAEIARRKPSWHG